MSQHFPVDQDAADAWQRAVVLRRELAHGQELPRIPSAPVRLHHDETPHAELTLGYSRFYATDVTYQQTSGIYFGSPGFVVAGLAADAIGNSISRSHAARLAAAQWRELQTVPVYLTSHRLLALVEGAWWLSWWHDATVALSMDLHNWVLMQTFDDSDPLRWHGLGVPWLAVALTHLGFGADHLIHRPELSVLGSVAPPETTQGGFEFPGWQRDES